MQYITPKDGLPVCPKCGNSLKEIWSNQGFTMPEGPEHWEIEEYECSAHGIIEPIFDRRKNLDV